MEPVSSSSWMTFVDRVGRRMIVLSTDPIGQFRVVAHADADSVAGEYDIWREAGLPRPGETEGERATGKVRCVEIQLNDRFEPRGFPEHLLDPDVVRRGDLLTVWSFHTSFMWRTLCTPKVSPQDDELAGQVGGFASAVEQFSGFMECVYRIGDLRANTKWDWGFAHGVYCFMSPEGEVQYVGRALGSTLGQRIWNQMQSQDDSDWREVVTNDDTLVRVFTAGPQEAFMASALEAYLIERLKPRFNLRCQ